MASAYFGQTPLITLLAHEIAVEALLDLIAELVDVAPCEYDHDDMCQAHFIDARPCPHERAQKVLAARTAKT